MDNAGWDYRSLLRRIDRRKVQVSEVVVRLAKNKRVSTSWIVRDAVEKYLSADIPLLSNLK